MMDKSKSTTLQNVILASNGFADELFVQPKSIAHRDHDTLRFRSNGTVCLDSIFNSFFVTPWQRWTSLREIDVEIHSTGSLRFDVVLHTQDTTRTIGGTPPSDGASIWHLSLPNLDAEEMRDVGRISLIIRADAGATVSAIRFATSQTPVRDVRLSLGICSFNRPQNIDALLRTFEGSEKSAVQDLIIVDQGDAHFDQETAGAPDLPANLNVSLIRQPNLGGSGGFTRTIVEALRMADQSASGPTHHVLMDDDAVASPDQWTRVAAFFAFAQEDVALGGPMLELETPWRLHEAGIHFPPRHRRRVSAARGLDARSAETLRYFHNALEIDAHGWWCWGTSIAALKRGGAPLNLFIKYDDIEYTYRLKELGMPTAVLPGASVWHEAFAHKPADWRTYYTLRNEAIFQALHEPTPSWRGSPVLANVWPVFRHRDYVSAELALDAIEDFLHGPEAALPRDPVPFHQERIARFNALKKQYGQNTSITRARDGRRGALRLLARMLRVHLSFITKRRALQSTWRHHLKATEQLNGDPAGAAQSFEAWARLFDDGVPSSSQPATRLARSDQSPPGTLRSG